MFGLRRHAEPRPCDHMVSHSETSQFVYEAVETTIQPATQKVSPRSIGAICAINRSEGSVLAAKLLPVQPLLRTQGVGETQLHAQQSSECRSRRKPVRLEPWLGALLRAGRIGRSAAGVDILKSSRCCATRTPFPNTFPPNGSSSPEKCPCYPVGMFVALPSGGCTASCARIAA